MIVPFLQNKLAKFMVLLPKYVVRRIHRYVCVTC